MKRLLVAALFLVLVILCALYLERCSIREEDPRGGPTAPAPELTEATTPPPAPREVVAEHTAPTELPDTGDPAAWGAYQ